MPVELEQVSHQQWPYNKFLNLKTLLLSKLSKTPNFNTIIYEKFVLGPTF